METESIETGQIRFDDLALDRIAQSYPEEMREPFMWLGWFVREECGRSLEVLLERARELNIEHDKTTWSKIIRGRFQRDGEGKALPSPVIALPKFLKAVAMLRDDYRVREMAGKVPFIMTPTAELIFNFIDARRSPERVNRFGVIVGFTGTQKTATFKEYCRKHNHGLCVWLEAPENGGMKEFVTWLAMKYGAGASDGYDRLRRRIIQTVKSRNTIIVDNAQSLYRPKDGTNQQVFNFLRRLQDEKSCTVILSITPEFQKHLVDQMLKGYFEQFEGRAGGRRNFLALADYPTEEDVRAIAKAFGLRDAEKHTEYLMGIAREPGRVRRLFEDLQEAKMMSQGNGKGLTIGLVKEARGEE